MPGKNDEGETRLIKNSLSSYAFFTLGFKRVVNRLDILDIIGLNCVYIYINYH